MQCAAYSMMHASPPHCWHRVCLTRQTMPFPNSAKVDVRVTFVVPDAEPSTFGSVSYKNGSSIRYDPVWSPPSFLAVNTCIRRKKKERRRLSITEHYRWRMS